MSRLIDADALKQTICLDQCGHMKETCDADCELIAYITNAPTIEAEPVKHGRWIDTENNSSISGYCSSCGWKAHMYEDDVIGMPYCPNCGARMNGGNA